MWLSIVLCLSYIDKINIYSLKTKKAHKHTIHFLFIKEKKGRNLTVYFNFPFPILDIFGHSKHKTTASYAPKYCIWDGLNNYLLHMASTSCLVMVGARLRRKMDVVLCKLRGFSFYKEGLFHYQLLINICLFFICLLLRPHKIA